MYPVSGCDPDSNLWQHPLGEHCKMLEARILQPWISRLHGETVLWAGEFAPVTDPFANRMIKNPVWIMSPRTRHTFGAEGARCCANLEELPFQSRSVDAIVLQHTLEVVADPRVVLREVARVLVPGGHLVISGFNPYSLLGLRQLYADFRPDILTDRHMVNPLRLFDWLTLLGLDLASPPLYRAPGLIFDKAHDNPDGAADLSGARSQAWRAWLRELPFGGLMAVHAVKQTGSYRIQWSGRTGRREPASVAYPSIASWNRRGD